MTALETKIPPPVIALAFAALAWILDRADLDPSFAGDLDLTLRAAIGGGIAAAGLAVAGAGSIAFRAASTTFDPHHIDRVSAMVTGGIYRFTRNPMYLGLLSMLTGWCVGIGTIVGFVVAAPVFVAALTLLQIRPEERFLAERFGAEYVDYCSRVRRWI